MAETKWEIIARRKREAKQEKAIDAWTAQDRSWMRFTRCWFCGMKYCLNNYADRKVRIPKVEGVPMCPSCSDHGRGKFLAAAYTHLHNLASTYMEDPRKNAHVDSYRAFKALKALPYPPQEIRDFKKPKPEA
jgi:hypothetical protein